MKSHEIHGNHQPFEVHRRRGLRYLLEALDRPGTYGESNSSSLHTAFPQVYTSTYVYIYIHTYMNINVYIYICIYISWFILHSHGPFCRTAIGPLQAMRDGMLSEAKNSAQVGQLSQGQPLRYIGT